METYFPEIIDNIKHEPERHFVVVLLDYQETSNELDETLEQTNATTLSEIQVKINKFNAYWSNRNVELFATYFACEKCDFVAKFLCKLKMHSANCKGNNNKCPFCDKKFTKNDRRTHERLEHRKGSSWQCNQCPYNTLLRHNLKDHCRSHFKPLSCETCKKNFAKPSALRNHLMQHRHGVFVKQKVAKFECKECEKPFATKHHLRAHKVKVHSQRIVHCDLCGKTFRDKDNMRRHMNIHGKDPCKLCGKLVADNRMDIHIKLIHPSGESFLACRIALCKQKFSSFKQLNEHESIHVGKKLYKCPKCSSKTEFLNDMKRHMRINSH